MNHTAQSLPCTTPATPPTAATFGATRINPACASRRVVVVGATGSIGRALVADALSRGWAVTAFARRPEALELEHPALTLMAGDVKDSAALTRAIAGHEGVLIALGASPLNRDGIRAEGTANVITAMQAAGVRRVVCLSILGAGDSHANLPWGYKAFVKPLLLRYPYQDHAAQEALLAASELDWTVVRPPTFTDGERTGSFHAGFGPAQRDLTLRISRADLAGYMLDQVEPGAPVRTALSISY